MMSDPPIRVLLADDHAMVRRGLATFLKVFDDLELAGEAANGEAAIQLCGELHPDVVLMDVVMPGMDGITATEAIGRQFPAVKVIALTSFMDQGLVEKALQAGAISYLLKSVSAEELVGAIRAAHLGLATLSREVSHVLVQASNRPPTPGHDLTKQERVVLGLLVEGLTNKQIAARLVVGAATIKSHVSNILSKLAVQTRTEAATLALRHHLTP